MVVKSKLEEKVFFTGYLEHPEELVQNLDLVLVPSEYEPFGLVAIEAMALKKPVIANNVDGLKEIIENNVNGFLLDIKNTQEFAEKIKFLYQNKAERKKMGEAGLARFEQNFSAEKFMKNLGDLYKRINPSV
jgi:glycosyltransferase involved in cell wall biosynthesis